MKEKFKNIKWAGKIRTNLKELGKKWEAEKEDVLNSIIAVCEEYDNNGDKLTLRQLYYQLVSKDAVPNHDKVYKKISTLKDELVYGGAADWSIFEDRGRVPFMSHYDNSIEQTLNSAANWFRLNKQLNQKSVIEVWTEKDAISAILKSVAGKYNVRLVVNKGYNSTTAIYQAYEGSGK